MTTPAPRTEATRILVDVAAGRRPADLVIRNGRWVNVHSGEILPGTDLTIACGRFASCGLSADGRIGPETEVIDAAGRFLVPGLLDAHVHIESSMLTLTQYAAVVLPRGTTGVFLDPHEIANVLGLAGVELLLEEARELPLAAYLQIPSCVPAASALETGGASLSPADIDAALAWPGVIGLGEMMDFPGVAAGDPSVHAKLAAALRRHAVIGGHYASPDLGTPFHAYVAGGAADCHEGRSAEDLRARVRQGMAAMVRQGSAWRDLARQLPAVLDPDAPVDPRHVLLCTDDRHAETLLREGHMDAVVRDAIAAGIAPVTAIQMATLNTAEHFGLADEIGSIAPGRRADLFLVDDLNALHPRLVIAAGHVVAEHGALQAALPSPSYPPAARNTVHLSGTLAPDALIPPCPPDGPTMARVIGIRVHDVVTESLTVEMEFRNGALQRPGDLAWLAVVERHHGTGRVGHGLVRGFGLRSRCGLASTIAHDSHNLIVLGSCPERMAEAAHRVAAMGGGVALATENGIAAALPLPIAGLISDRPAEAVAAAAAAIDAALADCGCTLEDAMMTLSFLALPVIPALRLTDRGLVDVLAQRLVPLFLDPDNPRS